MSDSQTEYERAPGMCPCSYTEVRRASRKRTFLSCSAFTSSYAISMYGLSGWTANSFEGCGGGGAGAVVVVAVTGGFAAGLMPTVSIAAVAVGCVAVVAVGGVVIVTGCVVVATVCVTGTGAGATAASRAGTFSAFGYAPTSDTLRSREAKAFATSARRIPAATIATA